MKKVIKIATTNLGKIREIQYCLGDHFEIEPIMIDLIEPQNSDMIEVSKSKARQAFEMIGEPILVDDSGIYFEKYNQFPGVYSKMLVDGVGIKGIKCLVQDGDKAFFQTVISYMDETLKLPESFIGKSTGRLDLSDASLDLEQGFPYNHLFKPDGYDQFIYQIPMDQRMNFGNRMKAASQLKEYLTDRNKLL